MHKDQRTSYPSRSQAYLRSSESLTGTPVTVIVCAQGRRTPRQAVCIPPQKTFSQKPENVGADVSYIEEIELAVLSG